MALVKAIIAVEKDGKVEPDGKKFTVLFNPEDYTINKDNNFAAHGIPGLSSPLLQFVHGNLASLEMELLFDTYDNQEIPKPDVRDVTSQFIQLMEIDKELHAPPVLWFIWGSLEFRCVLARASQKFIMFWENGAPVRARITATFNEYVDPKTEAKKVGRRSVDVARAHVVTQGESLSGLAARYYKNAETWRPIAIANDLDDPRTLVRGQILRIPSLPFTDPDTGEVIA
jgi:nucleoid-associated protein YgaU